MHPLTQQPGAAVVAQPVIPDAREVEIRRIMV
jgi:hypothetical protein